MTPAILTTWHAVPLSQPTAKQHLESVRHQLKHARADYQHLHVLEAQARFWSGRDISHDIDSLLASADNNCQRAYLHLLYGQLLMSCKLIPAMEELDAGFKLAVPDFAKADYLIVMRRHDALRHLPLSKKPSSPLTVHELLNEAAVIRQLKGHANNTHTANSPSTRFDTLG